MMQLFLLSEKFFEDLYAEVIDGLSRQHTPFDIFESIRARLCLDEQHNIRIAGACYSLTDEQKTEAALFAIAVFLGQHLARRMIYLQMEDSNAEPTKH